MVLIAEVIIIGVLIIVLIALFIEEARIRKSKIPRGSVKEYWNGRERRKTIRINTSLTVRYIVKKNLNRRFNGQMKDISRSGMKFIINEKLAKGTLLLFEFELPYVEKAIAAEGKVVWATGEFNERDEMKRRVFYTGIQFTDIKSDDENKLVNHIKKIAGET